MKWKYFLKKKTNNVCGYQAWDDSRCPVPDNSYVNINPDELGDIKDKYGNLKYILNKNYIPVLRNIELKKEQIKFQRIKKRKEIINKKMVEIIERIAENNPKIKDIINEVING